jgi:WD40 repeat protein/tetratricopeptide (TPR) repeat protein
LIVATSCDDRKIYLWDVSTGTRQIVLEGHRGAGIDIAFSPTDDVLVSRCWDGKIRLWDTRTAKLLISMSGGCLDPFFRRDGHLLALVEQDRKPSLWEVATGREYRTLEHRGRHGYQGISVHPGGRLMAAGMGDGVAFWDLASGKELLFLPIGPTPHLLFEPSGDLLTRGGNGVLRWPMWQNAAAGTFRIGSPRLLPLPAGDLRFTLNRDGRILALAQVDGALAVDTSRLDSPVKLGPHGDVRWVAVSPDGRWVATGGFHTPLVKVWEARDGTLVKELPTDSWNPVAFSPDGRWLMTGYVNCCVWTVGSWTEGHRIGGTGLGFSPDGRFLAVETSDGVVRLVDPATGRDFAALEAPNQERVSDIAFSPDGAWMAVTSADAPAIHVWDLRAIGRRLTQMDLGWDLPEVTGSGAESPAHPLRLDLDQAVADLIRARGSAQAPSWTNDDTIAQAQALAGRGRWDKAAAAYARALADGRQDDPGLWFDHAILRLAVGDTEGYRWACRRLLDGLARTNDLGWLELTAHACALAPGQPEDAEQARQLAERRRVIIPKIWSDHVLGLALYRAGRFDEAVALLRGSLDRGPDWDRGVLDWLVLAMAHWKLGQPEEARRWLDRAGRWAEAQLRDSPGGLGRAVPEGWRWRDGILLHLLLREARALVAESTLELPDEVFAAEWPGKR